MMVSKTFSIDQKYIAFFDLCSPSNTPKYFTQWIGISFLPSIFNLKLRRNFRFLGMSSTSSVFLILRLNLFSFSQFERLVKSFVHPL